jgi:YVTN family beta-propeller protein
MTPKVGRRDRFRNRRLALVASGLLVLSVFAAWSVASSSALSSKGFVAYVTNAEDEGKTPGVGSVFPIDLTNNKPGAPIEVGKGAGTNDLIVTANGKTGYSTNEGTNSVVPITLATGRLGKAIKVGSEPVAIAFVPHSGERWVWVANYGDKTVSTVNVATGKVGQTIAVPEVGPNTIAFTKDGRTCYVANWGTEEAPGNTVTPIQVTRGGAGGKVLPSLEVGLHPNWIAISHDGRTAYVANKGSNSVTPIDVATNTAGTPIPVPGPPIEMEISPDGKTGYVAIAGSSPEIDEVMPFDLTATPVKVGSPIKLKPGAQPHWIAFTPDGRTAYVVGNGNSTVTPITVATDKAGRPIKVTTDPQADLLAISIVEAQN